MAILFTSILCWIGIFFVNSMKFGNADFFYKLKVLESLIFSLGPFLILLYSFRNKSISIRERGSLIVIWLLLNGYPLFMALLIGGTALAIIIDPTFLEQKNW